MSHGIVVLSKVKAENVSSLNRAALGIADLDNGNVVQLLTRNTAATRGLEEVWDATRPATTTGLQNLWMVYEPEVVTTLADVGSSKKYKGINPDPSDFYIPTGEVFSAFKPQVGDIILITGDSLGTGTGAESAYVVATASTYKLTWAAAAVSGLSLKYLATDYISLGSGAINSQRVDAYLFEVTVLA